VSEQGRCPHKDACALFPLFRLRSSLQYWMESYCDADFTRCQRYQSLCEGRVPPPTLLPSGKHVHAIEGDPSQE
jgi:hypothetical protein